MALIHETKNSTMRVKIHQYGWVAHWSRYVARQYWYGAH